MKKKLYKNNYIKIFYYPEIELMEVIRTPETEKMLDEEYKKDVKIWAKLITEYKPKIMFIDSTEMRFIIDDQLQQWTYENLVKPAIEIGMKKIAFKIPKELFSYVAIQQTIDDTPAIDQLQVKYFNTKEEALDWLEISDYEN